MAEDEKTKRVRMSDSLSSFKRSLLCLAVWINLSLNGDGIHIRAEKEEEEEGKEEGKEFRFLVGGNYLVCFLFIILDESIRYIYMYTLFYSRVLLHRLNKQDEQLKTVSLPPFSPARTIKLPKAS